MKVTGLWVFPVKSCKGIPVNSALHTATGLAYDRQWVIIKEETERFVTQREVPTLALVETWLPPEALDAAAGAGNAKLPPEASLKLSAPSMPQPLHVALQTKQQPSLRKASVWDWTGLAADEGDDAAAWFTALLGFPARLVRHVGSAGPGAQPSSAAALGTDRFCGEWAPGYEIRFNDGFPLLMASEDALAELNRHLAQPIPMNRFRPNIVVAGGGADAWAEDTWQSVRVGHGSDGGPLQLELVKPCSRCKVTTTDQATGAVGDEPLETLGRIRSGEVLGWAVGRVKGQFKHAVFFGWNVAGRAVGRLSVGDSVEVLPRPAGGFAATLMA